VRLDKLLPKPDNFKIFRRSHEKFIPERPGCYVLVTFSLDVLYVGLATNLRRRMANHLDDDDKTSPTSLGRATYFYWLETREIQMVERTWMNVHIQHEGLLPPLNKVYSPIST
jgi:hypothetical protein